MRKIIIDPITRIEGHLAIEAMVDDGIVKEVKSAGTLFRGFEIILKGCFSNNTANLWCMSGMSCQSFSHES